MNRATVGIRRIGDVWLLACAASLVGGSFAHAQTTTGMQSGEYSAHPSTQGPSKKVTLEDLKRWETELSNWGRWGPNDQIGTLNLITPKKMLEAVSLVREGITVGLQMWPVGGQGMDTGGSGGTGANQHYMNNIRPDGTVTGAVDGIRLSLHDGLLSHMDALCHYGLIRQDAPGGRVLYNGYPGVLTAAGCSDLATDKMGPGYMTRAVLVDMPLLRGVAWLEPTTPIYVEDLEEWERYAGIKIGSGDALMIRTGRWAFREAQGPWAYGSGGSGIHASVLPWLRERDVAIIVGDAITDVQPSGVQGIGRPIHTLGHGALGLPFVDNAYLEDAAEVAERLRRWEFMVTWKINPTPGGTSTPFNALAIF